ncbi:MAG: acyl-CoA dehydrogenase [Alphaproteobacteria bacterium]
MLDYVAPIQDMRFVLERVVGLDRLRALPGCGELSSDVVGAVLEEAGTLAAEVLSPLYASGDRETSRLENGIVRTPAGWKEAFDRFVEAGWMGLPFDPTHGGQGLPWTIATPVSEMWNAANLGFALCPMLTQGAAELLAAHGSAWQQRTFLRPIVEGRWTGTMNLTEPQAGSDLGAIRARAVPDGEHFRITGQKIYITYGDHDLAENIVHLVLARIAGAPEGVKGISLFAVPKRLVGADGSLGPANDVRCVSLEHKMGIRASPTAVLAYGDGGGATGYLIGEANRGLEYMFTMMNNERQAVGLQGVAAAERAYQLARAYARSRIQGRDAAAGEERVTIIRHPDVRRMLMTMKAQLEAMRAFVYDVAAELDRSRRHSDPEERRQSQMLVDFLTPVVKAWCTDLGSEIASLGIQVHGGMGFIEETGAAQIYRDVRITAIYEGTNGIQARDLVGRKLLREGGETARRFLAAVDATAASLAARSDSDFAAIRRALGTAAKDLGTATAWLLEHGAGAPAAAATGATPYLRLVGSVAGGWLMARSALAAADLEEDQPEFSRSKIATARFYAEQILPLSATLLSQITNGPESTMALGEDQF